VITLSEVERLEELRKIWEARKKIRGGSREITVAEVKRMEEEYERKWRRRIGFVLSGRSNPQIREIYKHVTYHGPKGSTTEASLIDTGATVTLLTSPTIDKIGLRNEMPGDVCGIVECKEVRTGIAEAELPPCRRDEITVFELDMNILGMDYLSDVGADIVTETGEIRCSEIYKFTGLSKSKKRKKG